MLEEPIRVGEGCTSLPPCAQFGVNLARNGLTQASVAVWGDEGGEGEATVGRQLEGQSSLAASSQASTEHTNVCTAQSRAELSTRHETG